MKLVRVDIGMATAGNTEDEERNNSGSIEDKELKETRQSFRRGTYIHFFFFFFFFFHNMTHFKKHIKCCKRANPKFRLLNSFDFR